MSEPSRYKIAIENLFRIYNKEGILVPFILNPVQQEIDSQMNLYLRTDILKPRQKGCSSYIMARFLIDCMNDHTVVAMLAHDKDHTEKLLHRAQELVDNMHGPKPKISRSNDNEMYFTKTQSSFYIGTAGSKNFGRSATITRLHLSELAFWKDPKGIRTGLLQAVPKTGVVVEETTANGYGTWYQQYYYRLRSLANPRTKPIFFGWNYDDEYSSSTPLAYPYDDEEIALVQMYSLTPEQIQWRREKLEEFDFDLALFKQEYPLSVEEAFRFSGGSLLKDLYLCESDEWVKFKDGYRNVSHPRPGLHYIIGADSSGGTGNDECALNCVCFETLEQVYEFGDNRMSTPDFARKIAEVGFIFNTAYIVPEANSHGLSTIAELKSIYPIQRIFRRSISPRLSTGQNTIPSFSYGWQTTKNTKAYLIGLGQKFSSQLRIYSPMCVDQLRAYTEDANTGQIVNSADHDDRGMALLLALMGVQRHFRFAGLRGEDLQTTPSLQDKVNEARKIISLKKWRDEHGNYQLHFEDLHFKGKKDKKFKVHTC